MVTPRPTQISPDATGTYASAQELRRGPSSNHPVCAIAQGFDGLSGSQVLVDDKNLGIPIGNLSHQRREFVARNRDIHEQHIRTEFAICSVSSSAVLAQPTNFRSLVPLKMDIRLSDNIEKSLASKIEIFFGVSTIVSLLH